MALDVYFRQDIANVLASHFALTDPESVHVKMMQLGYAFGLKPSDWIPSLMPGGEFMATMTNVTTLCLPESD